MNKNILINLFLMFVAIINIGIAFSIMLLIFNYINYKFSYKNKSQKIIYICFFIVGIVDIVIFFFLKQKSTLAFEIAMTIIFIILYIQIVLSRALEREGKIKKTEIWYERLIYSNIYTMFHFKELLFDER